MKYLLHSRDMEMTQTMEKAVLKSLSHLDKYHSLMKNDTKFIVEIRYYHTNQNYRVTINADIGDKRHIHGTEIHKDLFTAIKMVSDPIEKQLGKIKSSFQSHRNKISVAEELINDEITNENDNQE